MKRSAFLILFFISLSLVGQDKLTKIRVTPQWVPQSQFSGIYMACEKGFYREMGLDVEVIHPSTAISSINMLKSGQTDIISSQLIEAMLYRDSGVNLVNFLQVSEHNSLMILSHKPINNIKDLNHKKIGRWASGFSELAIAFVSENGIDVEWVPFLSNIALYISEAIDATLCMGYNEFFQLKMSGTSTSENQILRFRDLGYDIQEDGMYVMAEYYKKNKDILKKFAEATKQGWEWIRESEENQEEALDYVMFLVDKMNVPTNRVNQKFMLEEILRLQENNEGIAPYYLSKERFNFAQDLMIRNNFIFNTISYEEFVKHQ